jgi:hypothetical protein
MASQTRRPCDRFSESLNARLELGGRRERLVRIDKEHGGLIVCSISAALAPDQGKSVRVSEPSGAGAAARHRLPGLIGLRLVRFGDGSYLGVTRWEFVDEVLAHQRGDVAVA